MYIDYMVGETRELGETTNLVRGTTSLPQAYIWDQTFYKQGLKVLKTFRFCDLIIWTMPLCENRILTYANT